MKKYFAPLEGITGYVYRNNFEKYYGGVDKYFAPFMSPADNCAITPRERRDVTPENNEGIYLVPQILTKKSEHFIDAVRVLMDMGYQEINLNLGCPSGTVCAKGKGSGFLAEQEKLDRFLEDIYDFAANNKLNISIKTRVGRYGEDEWEELLEIYNKYPVYELIVHPRIGVEFYKGVPRMKTYEYALENSKNPLIYNGDIRKKEDIQRIISKSDKTLGIMLGRGLIGNPELLLDKESFDYNTFLCFHNELYCEYKKLLAPDKNVLFKMKELWTYWGSLFEADEHGIKKILKAKKLEDYNIGVRLLLRDYL